MGCDVKCRDCGRSYGNGGGHCTACHVSFATDAAFDAHILGKQPGRPHLDVTTAGAPWRINTSGYWTNSRPLIRGYWWDATKREAEVLQRDGWVS